MNLYQVTPAVLVVDGAHVQVFAVLVVEACPAGGFHRRAWLFDTEATALDARHVFGLIGHALLDEHGLS